MLIASNIISEAHVEPVIWSPHPNQPTHNIKPFNGAIYYMVNGKRVSLNPRSVNIQRSGKIMLNRLCKAFVGVQTKERGKLLSHF